MSDPGLPRDAPDDAPTDVLALALAAELGKKTGVSWVTYDGQQHAVWHTWTDPGDGGVLCLVSGGTEQPLPDIPHDAPVEVTMRSKDTGGRLLTWVGRACVVRPGDEHWDAVTAALVGARLNLPDLTTAADVWADSSVVRRIVPTGEAVERPGRLGDDAHLAPPVATPATTRGRLPRILHRRVRRRPTLS